MRKKWKLGCFDFRKLLKNPDQMLFTDLKYHKSWWYYENLKTIFLQNYYINFKLFFLKTLNCSGSSFSSWAPICLINLFCLALDRIKIFIFKIIHFLSKLLTENQASIPILNENQAVSQFMNEYQAVSNLL